MNAESLKAIRLPAPLRNGLADDVSFFYMCTIAPLMALLLWIRAVVTGHKPSRSFLTILAFYWLEVGAISALNYKHNFRACRESTAYAEDITFDSGDWVNALAASAMSFPLLLFLCIGSAVGSLWLKKHPEE